MNGNEHYIFILKHQFQNFLRGITIRYTHQTGKTSDTMIGMHLKHVAVPLRLSVKTIGEAAVNAARTRPKLIGGSRAEYPD